MKVLHLSEFYALVGGLEQYLLSLCDACEASGHPTAVAYATRMGREPQDRLRPAYLLPGLAGPSPAGPETLKALASVLQREAPDVVMVHEILDPEVLQLAARSAPTLRFVHGYKMFCPGGRRMWKRRQQICTRPVSLGCQARAYLERCMPRDPRVGLPLIARTRQLAAIHRRWSEVLVPSRFVQDLLLRNGFRPEQIHVTPYFTHLPEPSRAGVKPVTGRLFCAARLTPEKGVDHLLRALASLPSPAHLVIAGDGPARPDLETLAGALGLGGRVHFAGWLSRPAVAEAHREAQVVVVPSLWPETFGIVGIEAMASRRPVVAYDSGGVREWLVPDQTGYLVSRGDIPALSRAIGSLLENPARGHAFGQAGRRFAEERFSPERHLRDFFAAAEAARARWGTLGPSRER